MWRLYIIGASRRASDLVQYPYIKKSKPNSQFHFQSLPQDWNKNQFRDQASICRPRTNLQTTPYRALRRAKKKGQADMIKAVIFDIDNTLYDFDRANRYGMEAVQDYCARSFGLEEPHFQKCYRKDRKSVV